MRFFVALLVFNCCLLNFGIAQTIINAERFSDTNDSLLLSLAIQYNGTRGNATTDRFEIDPSILYTGMKNDWKLFGAYSVLSQSGTNILNSGYVHLRHNFKFTKAVHSFAFSQIQFNEVLLMKQRLVGGAGVRLNLIKKDSLKLAIGMGAMYEDEQLNSTVLPLVEVTHTAFIRITSLLSFKWILSKNLQLNNIVYYQPRIRQFSDFRLLNDISLAVKMNQYLQFIVSANYRYDSKPPSILKQYDANISIGLVINR